MVTIENNMSRLEKILNIKTQELRQRSYKEWLSLVNKVEIFFANYCDKKYEFEIQPYITKNGIKIMISCAYAGFFLNMFAKHKYLFVTSDNLAKDMDGKCFWDSLEQ